MPQIIHKVRKGETVMSICLQYRLPWTRFIRLNPDFNEFGFRHEGEPLVEGERLVVGYTDPFKHIGRTD